MKENSNILLKSINVASPLSTGREEIENHHEKLSANGRDAAIINGASTIWLRSASKEESQVSSHQIAKNILRLFVKNGEYIYARANDIIMIESCDHLVKVFLGYEDKIKKAIRHSTLKDFLLLLPADKFMRIGRFCAINMHRISGGNCSEQTFEFDFKISIKLKHPVPQSVFTGIGK